MVPNNSLFHLKKEGIKMKKGQVITLLPIFLIVLVAIGFIVFWFTQVRKPAESSKTNPSIVYSGNPAAYVQDTQKVTPTLDAEGVLNQILSEAGIAKDGAGVVKTQPNFQIEWIGGPGVFMVEIRSADLNVAKAAAEKWLMDQGFKAEDFCKGIKVTFYVSSSVRKSLPAGTTFNPNPSCR
jgi:hypothetical protein